MTSHSFKVIASLSLLTAAILTIAILGYITLTDSARLLDGHMVQIEASIRTGNWQEAEDGLEKMENAWTGVEKKWAMLIDHIEIDHIDAALTRLADYVKSRNTAFAMAESSTLRMYVRHIPKKEALSLENIF